MGLTIRKSPLTLSKIVISTLLTFVTRLVFQLVDFARNLTCLLSAYLASPTTQAITTSFPSDTNTELSEAEWARRRKEFEESEDGDGSIGSIGTPETCDVSSLGGDELDLDNMGMGIRVGMVGMGGMSPEEAGDEARRLDEAMLLRKEARR